LNINLNTLIEDIKTNNNDNNNNEKVLNSLKNIFNHLKAFNLLNEIFFYKFGNKEKEYNTLKIELKFICDNIERNIKFYSDKLNDNSMKEEFSKMQKKLNSFRNVSSFEDVVYESINL
jgi:hypothetical protein